MPDPSAGAGFVVAFVSGVTPTKWARIWGERMPRLPLTLRPATPADAVAALHSGEADVALLRLPLVDDALSTIRLYDELPVVVAPKEHLFESVDSVTLADLEAETIVDDVELVAANVGVAVMPQSVARALSRRDTIARPLSDGAVTTIVLAWPTERTTPLVEEFIGIVRGRTANSSRGAAAEPAAAQPAATPAVKPAALPSAGRGADKSGAHESGARKSGAQRPGKKKPGKRRGSRR